MLCFRLGSQILIKRSIIFSSILRGHIKNQFGLPVMNDNIEWLITYLEAGNFRKQMFGFPLY